MPAEIGRDAVWKQTDADNNTGTMPSWSGSADPNTIDDAGRAMMGAIKREWAWRNYTVTAAGTADAKTLTYDVAPVDYYNGQKYAFIANTTNTGSATLNVNSLGALTIKKVTNGTVSNLAAGDMVAGTYVEVTYQSGSSYFVWTNRTDPTNLARTDDANDFSSDTQTFGTIVADEVTLNGYNLMSPVVKPDIQTITTDVVMSSDDDLKFATVSGTDYRFKMIMYVTTSATADFRFQFDLSGGAPTTIRYGGWYVNDADGTVGGIFGTAQNTAHSITSATATNYQIVVEGCVYGATTGFFRPQWRQDTSDAGNTSVRKGSILEWAEI